MIHEVYSRASVTQRMLAVGGCILGGALVLVMGILGAFGGYVSLANSGYGIVTIPFYAIIIFCGVGILMRVRYALVAALTLEFIELVVWLCNCFLVTTTDVNFLFLVKIGVIVSCTQLMIAVASEEEEEEEGAVPVQRLMAPPQRGRRAGVTDADIENARMRQGCAVPRKVNGYAGAPQPKRTHQQAPAAQPRRVNNGGGMPPQPRR